jgi:hypothetical protein
VSQDDVSTSFEASAENMQIGMAILCETQIASHHVAQTSVLSCY